MKSLRNALATVSARDRRTLVIGAAIVAGAWFALRGVPWLVHRGVDLESRAALAVVTSQRAREALEAHAEVRDSLSGRAGRLVALAPRLLDGATPAEAAASLSALMNGAATLRHVRVIRQDARPDSTTSLFDRVVLRVEVQGDIAALAGWIADLEEGDKVVRVRSLTISAPEPAAPSSQPERLNAELVLEAWAMAPRATR